MDWRSRSYHGGPGYITRKIFENLKSKYSFLAHSVVDNNAVRITCK
jgi:hypothetical protein